METNKQPQKYLIKIGNSYVTGFVLADQSIRIDKDKARAKEYPMHMVQLILDCAPKFDLPKGKAIPVNP